MAMTRKEFCAALGGSTVVLLFQACGGGGGYGGPAPAACGSSGAAIAGNHGHVLTIARVDLDSMIARTYGMAGSASHDHQVTFSVAQLQTLKTGGSVTVTSTMTTAAGLGTHDHNVTASCP